MYYDGIEKASRSQYGVKKTRSSQIAPYDLSREMTELGADVNLDGEVSMPDAITIAMAVAKMKNAGCLYTKSMFEFIYYEGNLKV